MPVSRILLDNNVPVHLCRLLLPHEAIHASTLDWAALSNGELIRAVRQHGFDAMVTADKNIRYQQNLSGEPLAVVMPAQAGTQASSTGFAAPGFPLARE